MKYILCIFCITTLLLYSCNNNKQSQTSVVLKDSLKEVKDTSTVSASAIDSTIHPGTDIDIAIIPFKINYDIFKQRALSLNEPFSPDSALKALFPGHYYKFPLPADNKDTIILEAWSAPRSQTKKFTGWFDDDLITFPLVDSNETHFRDTLSYVDDDGRKNIFISFSSTEFTVDFLPVGRFTSAVLGLAKFTEIDKKWQLKNFSPALGYYGSFQNIPPTHLVKLGKNNYGCYIENCNGGAGGPYYCSDFIFGIVNDKMKVIFQESDLAKSQSQLSLWSSTFLPVTEDSTKAFSDLQVKTNGSITYLKHADEDESDTSDLPPSMKGFVRKEKDFDFEVISNYTFNNGTYNFIKQTVSTTSSKK